MWRIYGGAVAVIAGIAAFIEAHSNRPVPAFTVPGDALEKARFARAGAVPVPSSGLSSTAYDALRVGAWALIILGALTVALGLIRYWRDPSIA